MGEGRGGNIAGHNGLDERAGRRVMHAYFFHTGWSGGTAGEEKESQACVQISRCTKLLHAMIKAGHSGGTPSFPVYRA